MAGIIAIETGRAKTAKSAKKLGGVLEKMYAAAAALSTEMESVFSKESAREIDNVAKAQEGAAAGAGKLAVKQRLVNKAFEQLDKMNFGARFSAQVNEIGDNLSYAFEPIINAAMPAVEAVMDALATASGYFAGFINLLFGKTEKNSKSAAGALNKQAKAYSTAGKAAEKAYAQINGFDELNLIKPPSGGGGSGGKLPLPELDEDFGTAKEWADFLKRLVDPILQAWADYGDAFKAAWKRAFTEVKGAISDIGETFLKVWEDGAGYQTISNILKLLTMVGNTIADIAVAWRKAWSTKGEALLWSMFNRLNAILELLYSVGEAFREAWNDGRGQVILENIFEIATNINEAVAALAEGFRLAWESAGLGQAIMGLILDIFAAVLDIAAKITGQIREWASNVDFEPFLLAVRGLLEAILPLVESIGALILWLWDNVLAPLLSWVIETQLPVFIEVIAGVIEAIQGIIDFLVGVFTGDWEAAWSGIQTFFEGTWKAIASAAEFAWEFMQTQAETALVFIKGIWQTVSGWFEDNVTVPITGFFDGMWDAISGFAAKSFKAVSDIWATSGDWFKENVITPIGSFFSDMWNGIQSGADSLWSGVRSGAAAMVNSVINSMNALIAGVLLPFNTIIKGLNNIPGANIPEISLSIPNVGIPALASGAVIPPGREFLAVLGDQKSGRNLEAPENLIRQIVREESGGGEVPLNVTVELDGAVLYRAMKKAEKEQGLQMGGSFAFAY